MKHLLRKNILSLKPYSSARDEFKGEARAWFDANESPWNAPYNRYPDPLQWELKKKIAELKACRPEQIFLGNGSDEAIDLVYRAFCEPRLDNVIAIDPSYGMYEVCADINDVEYRKVLLDENYNFSAASLLAAADENSKVIWLCSPNNPTANLLEQQEIITLLENFPGLVVVDEAYIDFAKQESFITLLEKHPRLIVLQTFSKAWGSAAIRLGMAFASEEIIAVFNKIKYPYNVNLLTQQNALGMLDHAGNIKESVNIILEERSKMMRELEQLPLVKKVYPSDANFILIKVDDADAVYKALTEKGIIIRNRNSVSLCRGCLRITIGTPAENKLLINELNQL